MNLSKSFVIVTLLVLTYLASSQLHLLNITIGNLQELQLYNCDFEKVRGEHYSGVNLADLRRAMTDRDTLLVLNKRPNGHSMLRYQLYPIKVIGVDSLPVSTEHSFLLSLADTAISVLPDGFSHSMRVRPGLVLYSKQELTPHGFDGEQRHWSFFLSVTLVFVLATWLTGRWVMLLCQKSTNGVGELPWLSFPIGFVVINLATMFYAMYINTKPSFIEYVSLLAVCVSPAFLVRDRLFSGILRKVGYDRLCMVSLTLYALSGVSFSVIIFQLAATPMLTGDAVLHWIFKSKIIFHQGYDFSFGNRMEYPIFWSNYSGVGFHLTGAAFDQMSKWIQVVVVISYAGALFSLARELRLSHKATGILLFGSFSMSMSFLFASLFAETIHSLFILFTVYQAIHYFRTGNLNVVMLAVGFIGMVMTKIEGMPQGAILVAGLCLSIAVKRGVLNVDFIRPISAFAISLAIYGLWIAFSGQFIDIDSVETLEMRSERMSLSKLYLWARMSCFNMVSTFSSTGMLMGMTLALVLANRQWDMSSSFVMVSGILMLIFSQAAILGWELNKILTVSETATPRLLSHALPFVVLLAAMLLDKVEQAVDGVQ